MAGQRTTAHARAILAPVTDMATYLQDLLGQKLTAVMLGIGDPKAVGRWGRGERRPHPGTERRLRDAFQVAELLMQVESRETVRAWFIGMNPELDDRPPALVLANDPAAVMRAARAFLSGG